MSRKFYFLTKSTVLIFITVMLFACKNDLKTINTITFADTLPSLSAKDIDITYSDSGIVKAHITSKLMNSYDGDEPYFEFPEGISIEFYDTAMYVKSQLTANYAIHYEKKKMMEAKNDVVIINFEKDEKINTEHIVWDQQKKKIYSDVFVTRTTKDNVLFADGFDANENFTKYSLRNPKAEIYIDQDE